MSRILCYARTSTTDQVAGLEAQIRDLQNLNPHKIYQEQVSSVTARPELAALLADAQENDTIAVTKLDRLARSTSDLLKIVADLENRKIGLVILSMGGQPVDTRTPVGRLLITMLGAIAEFERTLMLERQREGIAKAKKDGKYKGRKTQIPAGVLEDVYVRLLQGDSTRQVAAALSLSKSAVHRAAKHAPKPPGASPAPQPLQPFRQPAQPLYAAPEAPRPALQAPQPAPLPSEAPTPPS